MARKDPYDPEEGIIDLFDIVDDPEASPEPEPRGALHDDGGKPCRGSPKRPIRKPRPGKSPNGWCHGILLRTVMIFLKRSKRRPS